MCLFYCQFAENVLSDPWAKVTTSLQQTLSIANLWFQLTVGGFISFQLVPVGSSLFLVLVCAVLFSENSKMRFLWHGDKRKIDHIL